jgi:hypothetical protein
MKAVSKSTISLLGLSRFTTVPLVISSHGSHQTFSVTLKVPGLGPHFSLTSLPLFQHCPLPWCDNRLDYCSPFPRKRGILAAEAKHFPLNIYTKRYCSWKSWT